MNNLDMLDQWGWINKNAFLWWDFNYPKEERRFIKSIDDFVKLFEKVGEIGGEELYITNTDYIPITNLPLRIGKQTVNFMVTARPFTNKELTQYFYEDIGKKISFMPIIEGNYFNKEGNLLEQKLLNKELHTNIKNGSKEFTNHFFPHIRGIIREVNNESIFYHKIYNTFWGTMRERDEILDKAINKSGFGFIKLMSEFYMVHDVVEAIHKSLDYCVKENLIYTVNGRRNIRARKPEIINDSFSYIEYEKIKFSKKLNYTYYPILVEGYAETIPFFICNNSYGQKGLFNLGVYSGDRFYPIKDEKLLIESSKKLGQIFGEEVMPVMYEHKKVKLEPKILK